MLGDTVTPVRLTVRNSGSGPFKVASIAPKGAKGKEFVVSAKGCIGATLPPGASCGFTVTVKPAAMGVRSKVIEAVGTGGERASSTVRITMHSAVLTVTPATLDLGAALVGTPAAPKTLTIRNTGDVPVPIADIALTGSQQSGFAITANTCAGATLKPKATCAISIGATPAGPPPQSVTVQVSGARIPINAVVRVRGIAPTTTGLAVTPTGTVPPPVASVPPTAAPTIPATAPARTSPPPTAAPVTNAPAVVAFTPSLVMRPAVGRPGGVIAAVGTGFPPTAAVRLSWEGDATVHTVMTDANGGFTLPVILLAGERIGGRYMAAADVAPAYSGVRAPFLVQLATFRPPGDGGRSSSMVGRG